MNLADNITTTDALLLRLTQQFANYYVTSNPADVPDFEALITSISSYDLIISRYPELPIILENILEAHYFARKSEKLTHRVLVVKFVNIDHYFLVKTDDSSCCCTGPYVVNELAVHLRLSSFDDTDQRKEIHFGTTRRTNHEV